MPKPLAAICAFALGIASCLAVWPATALAQFTTVFNLPPDPDVGDFQAIGDDTQLNLAAGGAIGNYFSAGASDGSSSNVEVNITGGSVGSNFNAYGGSSVNISGGDLGGGVRVRPNAVADISGGAFAGYFGVSGEVSLSGGVFSTDDFFATSGAEVSFLGDEFGVGGAPLPGLENIGDRRSFSTHAAFHGVFADGTPFIFFNRDNNFPSGTLAFEVAATPSAPAVVNVPADPAPLGARDGQTVNVGVGGSLAEGFAAIPGSTTVVHSGAVGAEFKAIDADLTFHGGVVGEHFQAAGGSLLFTGGAFGERFRLEAADVAISGGAFDANLALFESNATLSGGSYGDRFVAINSEGGPGQLTLIGGDFCVNGSPVAGLDTPDVSVGVHLPDGDVLSGTLADGTPFAFTSLDNDTIGDTVSGGGFLTLQAQTLPAMGPSSINALTDPIPLGIRSGQTLSVGPGGVVGENFNAGRGSRVEVTGGVVGENLEAVGAEVFLSAGSVGNQFDAIVGSTIEVTGGTLGDEFQAHHGSSILLRDGMLGESGQIAGASTLGVLGGAVGESLFVRDHSELTVSAGEVGRFLTVSDESHATFTGGAIGGGFVLRGGSEATISDGQFGWVRIWEGSQVSISGGDFSEGPEVDDSQVVITGGEIGDHFRAASGAKVVVAGGVIGDEFEADSGSVISIVGGALGAYFVARNDSTVNLSGGSVGDKFNASHGSAINVFGLQFSLDGNDLTGLLNPNMAFEVADRDVPLLGVLADGSPFAFDLNGTNHASGGDYFSPNATLTITLILPGDFNLDGVVDAADYSVWRDNLGMEDVDPFMLGDGNGDGRVTQDDYDVWLRHYGEVFSNPPAQAAVPSPSGVAVLLAAFAVGISRRAKT